MRDGGGPTHPLPHVRLSLTGRNLFCSWVGFRMTESCPFQARKESWRGDRLWRGLQPKPGEGWGDTDEVETSGTR